VACLFSPMNRRISLLFWLLRVLKIDSSRLSFSVSVLNWFFPRYWLIFLSFMLVSEEVFTKENSPPVPLPNYNWGRKDHERKCWVQRGLILFLLSLMIKYKFTNIDTKNNTSVKFHKKTTKIPGLFVGGENSMYHGKLVITVWWFNVEYSAQLIKT